MDILAFRSDLARAIRSYFESEEVQEVTTPLLRDTGAVEVHLNSIVTQGVPGYFMQTSPEYAMKVLVAKYGRSIYQICPAVRAGEMSRRHRIEFQMLEWYRYKFELADLANDLQKLLRHVMELLDAGFELKVNFSDIGQVSYKQLFIDCYGTNPHRASARELGRLAVQAGLTHLAGDASESDFLDALFAACIEPGLQTPVIVTDFPSCQAALAEIRTDQEGDEISSRFELFAKGLEIANAYQELDDAVELERRFGQYNHQRQLLGKADMALDTSLLDATGSIGTYSGIALGIDRLVMSLLGMDSIAQVTL